ncbi:MAG: hypothetical protein WCO05_00150 [Candidatus Moraniibacteriota bacterium]
MKIQKNKRGSFMIGVLIMLLVVSAISIAIVNRAIQGTTLALDSKKGYSAYQASDTAAEAFLNNLKALDNELAARIPENAVYNEMGFCDGSVIKCFDASPVPLQVTAGHLSDVYKLQSQSNDPSNGLNRKIQADLSDRINSGLGSNNFTVASCGSGPTTSCTWNKCDIKLTVVPNGDPVIVKKIKDYEVRRSMQGSLKAGHIIPNNGWWITTNRDASDVFVPFRLATAPDDSKILKNGDYNLSGGSFPADGSATSGGQYGRDYFFTIKARNKYPLSLDSLYLDTSGTGAGTTDKKVTIDSTFDCDVAGGSLGGLKCVKFCANPGQVNCQPVGTITATEQYNCCNGTECFQPDPNWTPQLPEENCALQKCVNREGYLTASSTFKDPVTDTVGIGVAAGSGVASGANEGITTGLGWCKTAQNCVPGDACLHPYRTVGYCSDCPDPSDGSVLFLKLNPSSWSEKNTIDVDMNPANGRYQGVSFTSPTELSKPRCCKQECPLQSGLPATIVADPDAYCALNPFKKASWNTTATSCANTNNCGPYAITKRCNLTCAANYNPFVDGAADPEYPSGKCCSETCPSANPPFVSHDTPTVTEGACSYILPAHGTSWTNTSICASDTNCAAAGVPGYDVTERCSLVCDNGSGKYGVTNADHFVDPDKACCFHKCSDWTEPACTQAIPDHSTRIGKYSCTPQTCGEYSITNNCDFACDLNYTRSGATCVPNTRSANCFSQPSNTVWNTTSTFTQTWNGHTAAWEPATKTAVYDINPTAGDCHVKCAVNYTPDAWNNCIGSTQTYTCSKPANSDGNPASYTQTWSGSWVPADDPWPRHSDTACSGECCYKCNATSTWDSLSGTCDAAATASCTYSFNLSTITTSQSVGYSWSSTAVLGLKSSCFKRTFAPLVDTLQGIPKIMASLNGSATVPAGLSVGTYWCQLDAYSNALCTGTPVTTCYTNQLTVTN